MQKPINIFDDLLGELRDENLLEAAALKTSQAKDNSAVEESGAEDAESVIELWGADTATKTVVDAAAEAAAQKNIETEFYRRRAKDEVTFLQIVEYVFAGVEREQLKIIPNPYDDLGVKKILHSLLQVPNDSPSPAHATEQFHLLQEIESWHSSLSLRDANVMTAHLRRFFETTRPSLGSPALVSLARFYRNSTYSEPVRSKFDLVVTRLFSKQTGKNRREPLFTTEELNRHLIGLYADWSSVSLYPTEANDAQLLEIIGKFEAFVKEADDATTFDELLDDDFFNRLHKFKESINENFFAPLVTAAAVTNNIHFGNRYVELLENEKEKGKIAILEDKYGFSHDQAVSEVTGKTLVAIKLLNEKAAALPLERTAVRSSNPIPNRKKIESSNTEQTTDEDTAPQFDKRLAMLAAASVLVALTIYLTIG